MIRNLTDQGRPKSFDKLVPREVNLQLCTFANRLRSAFVLIGFHPV